MKGGIFSLRRLRWKLAFSYTLVTVVALLSLEVLVLGAGLAFLTSPALPFFVRQDVGRFVAPQMRSDLATATCWWWTRMGVWSPPAGSPRASRRGNASAPRVSPAWTPS